MEQPGGGGPPSAVSVPARRRELGADDLALKDQSHAEDDDELPSPAPAPEPPQECAICLETVRSPRRFPNKDCTHEYCARCLATLRGQPGVQACPQCRRPATPTSPSPSPTPGETMTPRPMVVAQITRPTVSALELELVRRRTFRTLFQGEDEAEEVEDAGARADLRAPLRGFVTRTGSKFHTSRTCRGLLNAQSVWEGSALGKVPCQLCGGGAFPNAPAATAQAQRNVHFVTRTGAKYHRSRECRGLRNAHAVLERQGRAPLSGGQLLPCSICCAQ